MGTLHVHGMPSLSQTLIGTAYSANAVNGGNKGAASEMSSLLKCGNKYFISYIIIILLTHGVFFLSE